MKPDWKDAPEWATALAQDADGDWYWYANTPEFYEGRWGYRGAIERAKPSPTGNWKNSLELRP